MLVWLLIVPQAREFHRRLETSQERERFPGEREVIIADDLKDRGANGAGQGEGNRPLLSSFGSCRAKLN
jgi:hypothetical protein